MDYVYMYFAFFQSKHVVPHVENHEGTLFPIYADKCFDSHVVVKTDTPLDTWHIKTKLWE